ncbi:hypothetical protein KHA80_03510 [Anaerobacillus sp. HL2]|nr:hypothetical protein KHA80_03510 [Anaerobacillus sp. HL2]
MKKLTFQFASYSEYEEAYFGFLAVVNSTNVNDGITVKHWWWQYRSYII